MLIFYSYQVRNSDQESYLRRIFVYGWNGRPRVDGDVASVSDPFPATNARRERLLGRIFGRKVDSVGPALRKIVGDYRRS